MYVLGIDVSAEDVLSSGYIQTFSFDDLCFLAAMDASSLMCCSPSKGGIKFLGQPDVVGLCSVPTQSCTPMCGLCSPGYVYGVWLTFEEDGIPILNCSLCQWP